MQYSNNFWRDYEQFFPLMSNLTFGDNFAANFGGGSASINGNNLPEINQLIATTGPQQFPTGQLSAGVPVLDPKSGVLDNPFVIGVGLDAETIAQRSAPNRFNNFLNMTGVGILAIVLIFAGVIYLGFTVAGSGAGKKVIEAVA